jgi:thiamine pyrophosphokinase
MIILHSDRGRQLWSYCCTVAECRRQKKGQTRQLICQMQQRRDLSYAFLGAGAPSAAASEPFDLIVLNRGAARHSSSLFERLWDRARLRIAADGGANGLVRPADGAAAAAAAVVSETSSSSVSALLSSDRQQDRVPTLVCGDLDSILPEVRARLERHADGAVPIVQSTCQDTTDLEKCLQFLLLSHRRVARTHPSLPQSGAGAGTDDEVALTRISAEAIVRGACFHEWDCSFEQAQAVEDSAVAAAAAPEAAFSCGDALAAPMAVLFGAFGGRFDQQMGALHAALKFRGMQASLLVRSPFSFPFPARIYIYLVFFSVCAAPIGTL